MPYFVWVVRDFDLELKNAQGEKIDSDEYLNQALLEKDGLDEATQ